MPEPEFTPTQSAATQQRGTVIAKASAPPADLRRVDQVLDDIDTVLAEHDTREVPSR